jgi:hypothetical protein
MTQSPLFQTPVRTAGQFSFRGVHRPRAVIGGLAAVVACAAIGVGISSYAASVPIATTRATPSDAMPIITAPAVSAQVRDRWYLEPRVTVVPNTPQLHVADRWYLETAPALAVAPISAQARDRWYVEPHSSGSTSPRNLPVIDRWYLDSD